MKLFFVQLFCFGFLFAQTDEQIVSPKPIRTYAPIYPAGARRNNIEGIVWLRLLVDTLGIPKEVSVVKSDNEVFNIPSVEAGKQYRFTPATKNGSPFESWITLPFKFRLGKSGGKIPSHFKVD